MSAVESFAAPVDPERGMDQLVAVVEAGGADQMDAVLMGRAGEYTRFADGRIHQPQDIVEVQVMVRAVVDGHAARAASSTLGGLTRAAATAVRLATALAATTGSSGSAAVATAAEHPLAAEIGPDLLRCSSTEQFDASVRAALVRDATAQAAASGGTAAGMIGRAMTQLMVVTSAGVRRRTLATEALAGLTVAVNDGTSHFIDLGRSAERLQLGQTVPATVEQAVAAQGRSELEPGEYTVVLGPEATAELLEFLPDLGFTGESAAAGVGLSARSAGQRLAPSLVDIADDALVDVGLPIGFDIEGVPKRRVPFLSSGVIGEPVTDLRTAALLGSRSTGHAHIAREEAPATRAANIVMTTGPATEAELIAGVARGVYLQRFWYTRLVDRTAGTITGVTRDACFEIVDGRLGRSVAGMRFTQSIPALLATVDGIGDVARSTPVMNVWNGATSAPALRAHGFRLGVAPVRTAEPPAPPTGGRR